MWLFVDRMEADTVVLTDEQERVYYLSTDAYVSLVGSRPRESDVLSGQVEHGQILSAALDAAETEARAAAARGRLNRLFGR